MAKIKNIIGRKILDSRGDFTLEVDVHLDDGTIATSSVPSGASKGRYEAFRVTDMEKAISNVDILAKNLANQEVTDQAKIDLQMINTDGTANKSALGGNVILAISLGVCMAAAKSTKIPLYKYISQISGVKMERFKLPIPMFNVINGGKHADNNLPFQEFMVVPLGNKSFREKVENGNEIFMQLKSDLKQMKLSTNVGDEGGFAPKLNSNDEALELLTNAIIKSGHKPREDAGIAIDVAASAIPDLAAVTYPLSPISYYQKISNNYAVMLIEDGLGEDDWEGWIKLNATIGERVKIIGDDLYTTNPTRLEKGIAKKCANGVIIKPDQIGTLTETFKTIRMAKEVNYMLVISHRSGETESTFISDLAVGVGAEMIKTGAPSRGERVAKYNRLIRIEEELV